MIHSIVIISIITVLALNVFMTAAQCSSGWLSYGNSCYLFPGLKTTWKECFYYCTNIPGASMLCIHNADENSWIANTFQWWGWIGYTDDEMYAPTAGGVHTQQYAWVPDCSSSYTNWWWGEPNNFYNDDEDYVMIYGNGAWNDAQDDFGSWQDWDAWLYGENYCACQTIDPTSEPSATPTSEVEEVTER